MLTTSGQTMVPDYLKFNALPASALGLQPGLQTPVDTACASHRRSESAQIPVKTFAISCGCYISANPQHLFPVPRHAECFLPLEASLMKLIGLKPWLFCFTDHQARCIKCRSVLSDTDIANWNTNYPNWYHKGSVCSGWRRWNLAIPYAQAVLKKPLLCQECLVDGTEPFMTWCKRCFGRPTDLAIARAYWNTQRPLRHPLGLR